MCKKTFYLNHLIKIVSVIFLVLLFSSCHPNQTSLNEYLDAGYRYLEAGQYEDAINSFSEVLEVNGESYEAYLGLGGAHFCAGNYTDALLAYDEAISADRSKSATYLRRGNVLHELQEYDLAVIDFTKYIEFNPLDSSGYELLYKTYVESNSFEKAHYALRKGFNVIKSAHLGTMLDEHENRYRAQGNSAANLFNGGIICEYGQWLFFADNGLWRMPLYGGYKEQISSDICSMLNAYKGRLYFRNENQYICSMNFDGSDYKLLFQTSVYSRDIAVGEDALIFASQSGEYTQTIYKASLDGNDTVALMDSYDFSYSNGYIYYFNYSEDNAFVRINIKTLEKEIIGKPSLPDGMYAQSYFYYVDSEQIHFVELVGDVSTYGLRSISIDTGAVTTVIAESVNNFIHIGEWVYYTKILSADLVNDVIDGVYYYIKTEIGNYRQNILTLEMEELDYEIGRINFANEWVYYIDSITKNLMRRNLISDDIENLSEL